MLNLPGLDKIYSHWAIYYEDQNFYHFTTFEDGPALIKFDTLEEAGEGNTCRINNLDRLAEYNGYRRLPDQEIFARARSLLHAQHEEQGQREYILTTNNCEHFVTECVYGHAFSFNGDDIYNVLADIWVYEFVRLFIIYMGIYCCWKVDFVRDVSAYRLHKVSTQCLIALFCSGSSMRSPAASIARLW